MHNLKIAMLICDGDSSRIIFNKLKDYVDILVVIEEKPISKKILLKNRIKKFGYFKVFGQVLFILLNYFIKIKSRKRIENIKQQDSLNTERILHQNIKYVKSINDTEVEKILQASNPDLVIVNGTRIIKKNILNSISNPFVNTHVGITPKYRGVHGGYWALANNDRLNCGVTVHLVDEGIDTGSVLYQSIIDPTKEDDFNTYPYLQTVEAVKLLKQVIDDIGNNSLQEKKSITIESNLWYHPTILKYIFNRILKGVK